MSGVPGRGAVVDATNRTHAGQARAAEAEVLRWTTYNGYEARYDRHEAPLDYGCAALAAKLVRQKCHLKSMGDFKLAKRFRFFNVLRGDRVRSPPRALARRADLGAFASRAFTGSRICFK